MRRWRGAWRAVAAGLVLPVVLVGAWELSSAQGWINPLFYPRPSEVIARLADEIVSGGVLGDAGITARRLGFGYAIGAVLGVALGLVAGTARIVRQMTYPTAAALYVIPRIALLPLALVAFGITDTARVFIVAFSVFFICFFNSLSGAEQVPATHVDLARSYGAGRWQVLRSVVLPASLPTTFTGLRVALGFAIIVIVGTEFLAADDGLGASIWLGYEIFDFERMYAGIVVVTLLGLGLNALVDLAERVLLPWRR